MSSKWMARMHSQLPLNFQEERVKEVLDGFRLANRPHEVFPVGNRSIVVDFFLPEQNLVIECWKSISRRGVALTWAESKAAWVDLKFSRLKTNYPGIRCFALVEVTQVDLVHLSDVIAEVLLHADNVAYSIDDFRSAVCQLGGAS